MSPESLHLDLDLMRLGVMKCYRGLPCAQMVSKTSSLDVPIACVQSRAITIGDSPSFADAVYHCGRVALAQRRVVQPRQVMQARLKNCTARVRILPAKR